ncbi:hypothetical protein AM593_06340, partial [Mytilus galloprovincialis]
MILKVTQCNVCALQSALERVSISCVTLDVENATFEQHFVKREKEIINGNISSDAVIDYYDNWADNGYDEQVSPQVYRGPQMTAETVASLFDTSARDNTEILDIGAGTGLVATQVCQTNNS